MALYFDNDEKKHRSSYELRCKCRHTNSTKKRRLFLCVIFYDNNSFIIFSISTCLEYFNPLPQLYCFLMSSNGPLCLDIKIVLNKLHFTLLSSFALIILLNLAINSANSQLLQSTTIQHFSYIG